MRLIQPTREEKVIQKSSPFCTNNFAGFRNINFVFIAFVKYLCQPLQIALFTHHFAVRTVNLGMLDNSDGGDHCDSGKSDSGMVAC